MPTGFKIDDKLDAFIDGYLAGIVKPGGGKKKAPKPKSGGDEDPKNIDKVGPTAKPKKPENAEKKSDTVVKKVKVPKAPKPVEAKAADVKAADAMTSEVKAAEVKIKKKAIPKVVKDLAWAKWIGDNIAKHKCLCCEVNEIKMNSFHCGHIVAETNGGLTSVENLKPICAACNLSMGTENLEAFKLRCGFVGGGAVNKPKKAPKPKIKKPSADDVKKEKITQLLIAHELSLCPGKEERYRSIGSFIKSTPCEDSYVNNYTKHCNTCNHHYHAGLGGKVCPCLSL